MQPQDIIRAAIKVLKERGWHQSEPGATAATHARSHAGEPIPLYRPDRTGESVARINPDAATFSAYGALVVAIQQAGGVENPAKLWDTLHAAAKAKMPGLALGGENYVHPLLAFNDAKGRTVEEVTALLEEAAVAIAPDTAKVDPLVPLSIGLSGPMVEPPDVVQAIDDPISPAATHTAALAAPVVIGQVGFPEQQKTSVPVEPVQKDVSPDVRLPTVDWGKA